MIYLTLQEVAELENKLDPAWQSPREDCLRRTQDHTGFAHNKPEEFKKFLLSKMGERKYYDLRRKSNEIVKNLDYNKICGKFKEILLKRPQ